MVVKATIPRIPAPMPDTARAWTSQGRFMRRKCRQRSCLGLANNKKQPANKVEKNPISKIESCPPSALMQASPHENVA